MNNIFRFLPSLLTLCLLVPTASAQFANDIWEEPEIDEAIGYPEAPIDEQYDPAASSSGLSSGLGEDRCRHHRVLIDGCNKGEPWGEFPNSNPNRIEDYMVHCTEHECKTICSFWEATSVETCGLCLAELQSTIEYSGCSFADLPELDRSCMKKALIMCYYPWEDPLGINARIDVGVIEFQKMLDQKPIENPDY